MMLLSNRFSKKTPMAILVDKVADAWAVDEDVDVAQLFKMLKISPLL